jgi:hypothetical protein
VSWEQQVADKLFQTMWNRGQGLYALAQPYLAGRRVAELWPIAGGDPEHLRQLGAAEIFVESPEHPGLSFADGSVDVIICANFLPEGSPEAHAAWFSEMARVLSPTGWCVLRAPLPPVDDLEPDADFPDAGSLAEHEDAQELADDEWHHEVRDVVGEATGELTAAQDESGGVSDGEGAGEGAAQASATEAEPAAIEPVGDTAPDVAVAAGSDAGGEAQGESGPGGLTDPLQERRQTWRQFMRDAFSAVDIVEEVAFGGVSFRVPGTDDLAIVGDLSPLAAPAEFEIVLCGKSPDALPRLGESLLVPLAGYLEQVGVAASAMLEADDEQFAEALTAEALARAEADQIREEAEGIRAEASRLRREAERVRDEARLAAVAARDREVARDATIASLREATERQLRRIGELEAIVARTSAERDEAVTRAQTAEGAAREMESALKRRDWDVAGLEREVDRYGRAIAPKG